MISLDRKKTIVKVMLFMYVISMFTVAITNDVNAANESLLDTEGVSSIDDLKEKANKGATAVIWFLRLGGIVMLAVAFFQMYINPQQGTRAVVFAIIGTIGIVLAPQLVNGFNSFFSQ